MVLMIAIVIETLKVVAADIVGIDAGVVTFNVPSVYMLAKFANASVLISANDSRLLIQCNLYDW